MPVIITQDHTPANEKGTVKHFVDRVLSPLSDRIVTVSKFNRNLSIRLENLAPDKVVTIYNGIDVAKFACKFGKREARQAAGLPQKEKLLGIVARLVPEKNHQTLLHALMLLPESISSSSHCLIIGSGYLEDQLRRDVQELGLADSISFLGERTDIPTILHAIDLLVLPSHWECLPIALLEALAASCPVVATSVGGVPEVLDGVGWPLVSPKDPTVLAKAIAEVLQMPETQRNRVAEAGKRMVTQKFSREVSTAQVEQLYHSFPASMLNGVR